MKKDRPFCAFGVQVIARLNLAPPFATLPLKYYKAAIVALTLMCHQIIHLIELERVLIEKMKIISKEKTTRK